MYTTWHYYSPPLGLSDLPAALKFSARWGPTFKEIVRASTPRAGFATDKWRQKNGFDDQRNEANI